MSVFLRQADRGAGVMTTHRWPSCPICGTSTVMSTYQERFAVAGSPSLELIGYRCKNRHLFRPRTPTAEGKGQTSHNTVSTVRSMRRSAGRVTPTPEAREGGWPLRTQPPGAQRPPEK